MQSGYELCVSAEPHTAGDKTTELVTQRPFWGGRVARYRRRTLGLTLAAACMLAWLGTGSIRSSIVPAARQKIDAPAFRPAQAFETAHNHSANALALRSLGKQQATAKARIASMSAGQVGSRVNVFGLALLSELRKTNRSSVFISPLSITSALGMVSLGATPGAKAQHEFMNMWKLEGNSSDRFLDGLHKLNSGLTNAKDDVKFLNVNSVWSRSSINKLFAEAAREKFDAEAKELPSSPTPINEWCKKATSGMIPSILDSVDPPTVAILVNAVYFKGTWASKFQKGLSKRDTFTSPGKGKQSCTMMKRSDEHMMYFENDGLQMVELPYGAKDGRFSAVVLLPSDKTEALADLTDRIGTAAGAKAFTDNLQRFQPTHVNLQLPRFKIEFGAHDLKPELKTAFGLRQAFDGVSQFLRMSDDKKVHLSSVLHKVVVEVNEDGAQAAAVTGAVMVTEMAIISPPPPKEVIVNRPFIFVIRDTLSGMFLFAGVVESP